MSQTPPAAGPELRVAVTTDRMRATLMYPGCSDPLGVPDELAIRAAVEARGLEIIASTDAAIRAAAEDISANPEEPHEALLAQGTEPVHGVDGRFDFIERLSEAQRLAKKKRSRYLDVGEPSAHPDPGSTDGDELEALDHYERSTLMVVREGETVGTITPPTDGVDGRDVAGEVRAAVPGRAFEIALDPSIEVAPDGRVIANRSGLLVVSDGSMHVKTSLQLTGGVDFSTGNVDFPGSVELIGGVKDRFCVTADRDIEIGDIVEAATIEAGGSVRLNAGMAGRHKGILRAGGSVYTVMLDMVEVSIGRDLSIEREIKDAMVRVLGSIKGPKARIIAGRVIVGSTIEIHTIGVSAGTQTEVVVGRFPELEDGAKRALAAIESAEAGTAKYADIISRLQTTPKLNTDEADKLTQLMIDQAQRENAAENARRALRTVAETFVAHSHPIVDVVAKIFPGVELTLGPVILRFKRPVSGPLRLSLDDQGKPVVTIDRAVEPVGQIAQVERDPGWPEIDEYIAEVTKAAGAVGPPAAREAA
ncbi:MAG: FapA family protein [Planctomycetota bacterium]